MVYNSAVIGCGYIGCGVGKGTNDNYMYSHAGAYTKCFGTNLSALCDVSHSNLDEASKQWNISKLYNNLDHLFEENKVDIVSICTPDNTHYEIISSILKNYDIKCVFAEKPLSLTSKEAGKLVELAEKNGVELVVNYSRRFDKMHRMIKKDIDSGLIGDIQTVNGYYTKGTLHNGTHAFDLSRFFFGEVESVIGYDTLNEKTMDPTYDARLNFEAGFSGIFHSCDQDAYAIFEMDILGTKGRIRIYDLGHKCEYQQAGESPYYKGYINLLPRKKIEYGMENVLYSAVSEIVRSLDAGEQPVCSGTDGVMAIKIAESVSKSVMSGNSLCTIY